MPGNSLLCTALAIGTTETNIYVGTEIQITFCPVAMAVNCKLCMSRNAHILLPDE